MLFQVSVSSPDLLEVTLKFVVKANELSITTTSSDFDLLTIVDLFGSVMKACPPNFAHFEGNCYRLNNHYQTFSSGTCIIKFAPFSFDFSIASTFRRSFRKAPLTTCIFLPVGDFASKCKSNVFN